MASFRKWNPGWECKLWADDEAEALIEAELPDFLGTYRAFAPGILRADIFRVVVLYLRGGVYADLDMECLRPFAELLAAAGDDDWEVMLARDHPCHEKLHYKGRPMWLNAIMLAKPKSVYFARVLTELDMMAADGRVKGDAVGLTGPGLLTNVIETHENDLAGLGIRAVPWEWLHPLPNVFVRFPERPMYRRLIRDREWRDGKQPVLDESGAGGWRWCERPFAAHYWWHSYIGECRDKNMLERYAPSLMQSDGDIVETRLQSVTSNGTAIPESLACALATFAEQGCGTILQLGGVPEIPPAYCLDGVADRALAGFEWKLVSSPTTAESVSEAARLQPGLVISGVQQPDQLEKVAAAVWERRGALLLVPARVVEASPLKSDIEAGRWNVLASDDYCLLRSSHKPMAAIPEILHLPLCPPVEKRGWRLNGTCARLQTWHSTFVPSGWKTRIWKREDVLDYIGSRSPEVLDALWPVEDFAALWRTAKTFIAAREGGLAANADLLCLRPFASLFSGQRLMLSTRRQNDAIQANDLVVASEAGHRFWDGLESDALRWMASNQRKPLGADFLAARAKDASRFLREEDWPSLANPEWFGASFADAARDVSPWRIRPSTTLEDLFPNAYAIKA